MLPPIEDSVLQSNPKFAVLYATLSQKILDPSGATKNSPAQKERDTVSESLNAARIRANKRHLVRNTLQVADLSETSRSKSQSAPLPAELVELILLLSHRLSSPDIPLEQRQLLESTEQWALLQTYTPRIGELIASHLHNQALGLARILSPTSNPSFLHRQIPKIVPLVTEMQKQLLLRKLEIEQRRIGLVTKTTTLLGLYQMAITFTIHILEQNKHGAVSRNAKTKAEYLALSAKKEAAEAKILVGKAEKLVYTEDVKDALGNYERELRNGRERLKERRKMLERELWAYGIGREDDTKERTMKEIARVYGEMVRELEEISLDDNNNSSNDYDKINHSIDLKLTAKHNHKTTREQRPEMPLFLSKLPIFKTYERVDLVTDDDFLIGLEMQSLNAAVAVQKTSNGIPTKPEAMGEILWDATEEEHFTEDDWFMTLIDMELTNLEAEFGEWKKEINEFDRKIQESRARYTKLEMELGE
ncbi:hypothetical protein BP6252_03424 [Coleophoma cylindrospora]|uniref:Uncharacterized protein n=1 Tax=Coleophoma cylindrospora TaxID=1849047 RepID=A0A3D8S7N9_9HELO|nr:hypothetical protein BP6252_03424 [Coleophoma cylindrospora]